MTRKNLDIIKEFQHNILEWKHVLIPLSDGTMLAAHIRLPDDAMQNPVPAVLEYIPYRKRDFEAVDDSINHAYFAGHGYAGVRVDLRGAGESDGILTDEYLLREQQDGLELLQWIADQPWCDGNIGMMGISWGGFNSLQIAALRPPQLKAVITVCSTDDRYADDVHYMGGCLLGDNLSWASTMFAYNSCPPDPDLVGARWREMWYKRLEGSGLWLETWLRHQHRDDYWKHGSICENYDAITCPVMAVSGWADGYSNAVFRLMANLKVPRRALVGPWSHMYPHFGIPGPAMGFLQEAVRWWDQWLKGMDTGQEKEPGIRVWMQDSVPPTTYYNERPGRWISEPEWPSPHIIERNYPLAPGRLCPTGEVPPEEGLILQSPLSVGLFAGKWCSYSGTPDLPHDQREEDGGALIFQSAPLEEPLEILGAPLLELDLSSDQAVAMVAVRLSDVAPDQKVTRVTYGLLNLTHRDSHETPAPLTPHKRYRIRVRMNEIAQHFPTGHCLRVSVSTSYFPLAWPPPKPVRLTINTGGSHLGLPVRPPRFKEDDGLRRFGPPEGAEPIKTTRIEPCQSDWRVIRTLADDVSTLEVIKNDGVIRFEAIAWEVQSETLERYSYQDDDFNSVTGETRWTRTFRRGEWSVRTVTRTVLGSDADYFHLYAELDAYEGDLRVFSRNWERHIRRRLV